MNLFTEISLIVPGEHFWLGAPERLKFLRNPHRHLFHFHVRWQVDNNNRQIEFFEAENNLRLFLDRTYPYGDYAGYDFQGASCEYLAAQVLVALEAIRVEVWEDGENGGIATR